MRWLREGVVPARQGWRAGDGVAAVMIVVFGGLVGGTWAALGAGPAGVAVARAEAPANATPNCPGGAAGGVPVDAPCTALKVHGNTYVDNNRNGRYDPNTGDTRLPGVAVKLIDPASGG